MQSKIRIVSIHESLKIRVNIGRAAFLSKQTGHYWTAIDTNAFAIGYKADRILPSSIRTTDGSLIAAAA
ncbi:hypothetical protein ACFQAT_16325 [Undibacterium arcticum]|uniref:hypothetical protein n=1 Tax=Undibacterium arcticum TaxID=1762892 RepID=UPI003613F67D